MGEKGTEQTDYSLCSQNARGKNSDFTIYHLYADPGRYLLEGRGTSSIAAAPGSSPLPTSRPTGGGVARDGEVLLRHSWICLCSVYGPSVIH